MRDAPTTGVSEFIAHVRIESAIEKVGEHTSDDHDHGRRSIGPAMVLSTR
jgi:hypothetical protein